MAEEGKEGLHRQAGMLRGVRKAVNRAALKVNSFWRTGVMRWKKLCRQIAVIARAFRIAESTGSRLCSRKAPFACRFLECGRTTVSFVAISTTVISIAYQHPESEPIHNSNSRAGSCHYTG